MLVPRLLVRPAGPVRLLRPERRRRRGGGVAYFAHIGGFVFGLLLIKAVRQRAAAPAPARARAGLGDEHGDPGAGARVHRAAGLPDRLRAAQHGPDLFDAVSLSCSWLFFVGSSERSPATRPATGRPADAVHALPGRAPAPAQRRPVLLAACSCWSRPARRAARVCSTAARGRRPSRAPRSRTPVPDTGAARAGGGTAPSPLAVRLEDPRTPWRALQAPAALGAAVRRRHGPRAVAPRPDARAADRLADEDDDRAAGRRPGARRARRCRSRARRCATAAQASACSRAARRFGVDTMLHGLLLPSGNDAAIALAQRTAGHRAGVRGADERAREGDGHAVHALLLARRLRGPRQPLVRGRPRGARARRAARAAPGPDRAPPGGRAAVPDQGRPALPLQQQPAAADGLPRRDGREDRLHRQGGALPGGHRPPRLAAAGRRAARLARSRGARPRSSSTAGSARPHDLPRGPQAPPRGRARRARPGGGGPRWPCWRRCSAAPRSPPGAPRRARRPRRSPRSCRRVGAASCRSSASSPSTARRRATSSASWASARRTPRRAGWPGRRSPTSESGARCCPRWS